MQKLKLSKDTVYALKNFQTINPEIFIKKGSVITTISPGQSTILARYECPEKFKTEFGIYRLDKLLNLLSFFDEPDIIIEDKCLKVVANGHTAKMLFAGEGVINPPKRDQISLPSVDAEFDLKQEHINTVLKAAATLELKEVAFECDGKTIYLKAIDHKNPNGDTFNIEVADGEKPFTAIFNVANLKLIPADYNVQISAKGIAQFKTDKLTYWIAVEKDSTFEPED